MSIKYLIGLSLAWQLALAAVAVFGMAWRVKGAAHWCMYILLTKRPENLVDEDWSSCWVGVPFFDKRKVGWYRREWPENPWADRAAHLVRGTQQRVVRIPN